MPRIVYTLCLSFTNV